MHRIDLTLHESTQLLGLPFYPRLTQGALEGLLPQEAEIRGFDAERPGVLHVGIVHPGSSLEAHTEIIDTVFRAAQVAGYNLVGGQVAKLGDRALAGLFSGAGVFGLGGATAERGEVTGFAALIGALFGLVVGSKIETIEPILHIRLLPGGGWELVAVPRGRPGPAQLGLEPA